MSRWLPLEANPDVMNEVSSTCEDIDEAIKAELESLKKQSEKGTRFEAVETGAKNCVFIKTSFIRSLGVPENFNLVDVLGTDPELLALVPAPVMAVLLLFPTSKNYEAYCQLKEKELQENKVVPEGVYFMKQTIENACGTIALLHSIYNNCDKIKLAADSSLQQFHESTKDLSPDERGKALENNEDIAAKHSEHALLGQTQAPDIEEQIPLHFVSFVNVNGTLYEFDGRKSAPISYGSTNGDSFIQDAAKVCKEYMERDPNEFRFSLVALSGQ